MVGEAAVETRSNRTENASGDESAPLDRSETAVAGTKGQQRWRRAEVRVILDESLSKLPGGTQLLVEDAFSTWQDTGAFLPRIVFENGTGATASLKPDGQSTVLVAPITFKGHETDLAITIGFSNPSTGEISEADIVINEKHIFASIAMSDVLAAGSNIGTYSSPAQQESCTGSILAGACDEQYDLENVLAHEVGHFFGLGEDYVDTRATMFSCTSACEIHKRDLNESDVDAINTLYESALLEEEIGCTGVQIGGHPKSLATQRWAGWTLLLLAITLRRRSQSVSS